MSNGHLKIMAERGNPSVLVVMDGREAPELVMASLRAAKGACDGHAECQAVVCAGGSPRLQEVLATPEFSPWVQLLEGPNGESSTVALNRGLAWATAQDQSADYVYFLTPGFLPAPDTLSRFLAVLIGRPDAGAVGGQIEDPHGVPLSSAFLFPSPSNFGASNSPLAFLELPWLRLENTSAPFQVDWVPSVSLLVRGQAINLVGGFDEAMLRPYDAVDFCSRMRGAGFSCWHDPGVVVHSVEALPVVAAAKTLESRRAYWLKHFGRERTLIADASWLVARALSWVTAQPGASATTLRDFFQHSAILPRNRSTTTSKPLPPRRFPGGDAVGDSCRVGLVAIGRNEGERLRRCLESARQQLQRLVYVDSGSTDGSVALAKSLGAEVVELDLTKRFTAARARNAGYQRLLEVDPQLAYVQFVDGDCELSPGWVEQALAFAQAHPAAAVVAGRRRERFPEASVYNRLIDREWNTPIGLADAVGGDALIRVAALREVNGYDPSLIAGEEPEMCARMRLRRWEIWRIDGEMTIHDAALFHAKQWWQRTRRAGHAFAEVSYRYRTGPLRVWTREARSICFWGNPMAWPAWPLLWWRLYRRDKDLAYATSITIGKLPQLIGLLEFHYNRLNGKQRSLIEYK